MLNVLPQFYKKYLLNIGMKWSSTDRIGSPRFPATSNNFVYIEDTARLVEGQGTPLPFQPFQLTYIITNLPYWSTTNIGWVIFVVGDCIWGVAYRFVSNNDLQKFWFHVNFAHRCAIFTTFLLTPRDSWDNRQPHNYPHIRVQIHTPSASAPT